MMRIPALPAIALALALALLPASRADAQDNSVIYRCTSAAGEVSIQNGVPCAAGSRQEIRRVEALPTRPAPPSAGLTVAAPEAPARPPASDFVQVAGPRDAGLAAPDRPQLPAAARLDPADRLPPPPIYQCETWDNDSYVSEDHSPKPRCVRLDTAGVGAACETRYDQCARVGDRAACDGWRRRQREIESSWRYAKGPDKPALQEAFARVTTILQDSSCGL